LIDENTYFQGALYTHSPYDDNMLETRDRDHLGHEMYDWAAHLFPICRSITGNGVRETLGFLRDLLPGMTIHEVPTGTRAFDWTVPDEWNIREAYVENAAGERLIDFADHNLHLVGYSEPVDLWLDRDELDRHLYSLPDQPDVIPYVTSYYERRWGFCLTHRQRETLPLGRYHAVVRSTLEPGSLTYGELLLPGREPEEVLLSTYVCHPSMANDDLSGPVVTTALARRLASLPNRRLSYRIVYVPETIGSILYLSRHLAEMQRRTVAGFVVTCMGDERDYSLVPSRLGDTPADRVAEHVLRHETEGYTSYSFLDRGSDERQYCSPGVDLPVVSVMRSKYGCYPEYHTSADDLDLITPAGLAGSYRILHQCLTVLENNGYYRVTIPCEPQLSKRGLYPSLSTKESGLAVRDMMNVIAYCDGSHDLVALADRVQLSAWEVIPVVVKLMEHGLLERLDRPFEKGLG